MMTYESDVNIPTFMQAVTPVRESNVSVVRPNQQKELTEKSTNKINQ